MTGTLGSRYNRGFEQTIPITFRPKVIMTRARTLCLVIGVIISCNLVFAQSAEPQQQEPKPNPSAAQRPPEPALPYSPSLDLTSMDKSAEPCVDFYQYSCGGWKARNPIPPDQTSWSVYGKLYVDNLTFLRGLLEEASSKSNQGDPVTQKIGNYYAACMDEASVEKRGLSPIKPQLDAIAKVKAKRDLAALVAQLQLAVADSSLMFGAGSTQDPDNSEQQIAGFDQGGLGLPDRDYYTKEDEKSRETRERYLRHVQKVFELLGNPATSAKANAQTVMWIETALAKASLTKVERRDPYKLKNKMKVAGLQQLAPHFNWTAYLRALTTPKLEILNVTAPAFFKELNALLSSESLENWKTYLRFHVGNNYSPYLSSPFVQENFEFYRKYLRGAKELQPRWRRCVQYVDRDLGEALGQGYVRRVFSPELKQSTVDMTKRIEKAMEQRIGQLDWMSPETKKQALTKLHAIRNKVGYPDKWRDYSAVTVSRDDFIGNVVRATEFESHRQINKIGQPVDWGEWGMTAPTVNAYYNPQMNDINFPAGVLQPPLYDAKLDDAPNYGNTGGTIGHELTHGFDDEGRQFDAKGNLKDWWTKEDAEKFKQRAQCIEDQYSQYVVVDDIRINSKLTLGEDVADLGGEILAYMAWKDATQDKNLQPVDGLTPEQRFFIGFAQWDCANERPEEMRLRALTDPHSPARYRINGVVVNMPEFAEAFSCKAGQPMVKPAEKVCRVW
ncbi:MAG: M13 family metallopeptidase [Acidobacteriales bacterium]|nr:M13 family metallopeptidase [Terriglobales bacterium]